MLNTKKNLSINVFRTSNLFPVYINLNKTLQITQRILVNRCRKQVYLILSINKHNAFFKRQPTNDQSNENYESPIYNTIDETRADYLHDDQLQYILYKCLSICVFSSVLFLLFSHIF